jgi:hypothetical protein
MIAGWVLIFIKVDAECMYCIFLRQVYKPKTSMYEKERLFKNG